MAAREDAFARYFERARKTPVEAKKKAANPRSAFLKAMMPLIGDSVVSAYASGDVAAFQKAWTTVTQQILESVEESKDQETTAGGPGSRAELAKQMLVLKKQYRLKPTKTLEKQMAELKKKQEQCESDAASPMQKAMHDYDNDRIAVEKKRGER